MQCSYSCPQSQPEKFQQLSLGACRPFLRSNRRPRACVQGRCLAFRSTHRLTLTLPLTQAQAQAQAQAPHTRPLSLSRTHSHRLLRLTLCARAPSGQARPTQRPHVLAPPPIITLVAGRTAHHASLAAAVLWPRGMRIHALHHCRAYTRDSPTFPSDRSSPTHLLSRPMTSAPPASPLPPRTWTATPTPSPITARTLPRRPSAMPERTHGVSLLSLTDCIKAPSHLSLQRLT